MLGGVNGLINRLPPGVLCLFSSTVYKCLHKYIWRVFKQNLLKNKVNVLFCTEENALWLLILNLSYVQYDP